VYKISLTQNFDFAMNPTKERRMCIKFCANLGKSATETLAMIRQAFGEESKSRTRVFEWYARFKADRKSETGEEQSQGHARRLL
jgi:hypothetical protein